MSAAMVVAAARRRDASILFISSTDDGAVKKFRFIAGETACATKTKANEQLK
jgi:hypothetical protein